MDTHVTLQHLTLWHTLLGYIFNPKTPLPSGQVPLLLLDADTYLWSSPSWAPPKTDTFDRNFTIHASLSIVLNARPGPLVLPPLRHDQHNDPDAGAILLRPSWTDDPQAGSITCRRNPLPKRPRYTRDVRIWELQAFNLLNTGHVSNHNTLHLTRWWRSLDPETSTL